jgi:hypothetical protein
MDDAPNGAAAFRSIAALAERCGHYAWTEDRLFQLTGAWSAEPGETTAEITVRLSAMSTAHAVLAAGWGDRLPVRAGVDREALVVAPPGPLADALAHLGAAPSPRLGLAGLVTVVLPRVLASYRDHLADASPVSEAPVRAVLEAAVRSMEGEISVGRGLLEATAPPPSMVAIASQFCHELEGPFGASRGIFPVAWPS